MTSAIRHLYSNGLIHPPSFLLDNLQYEVLMGSEAYGTATDTSDKDIYGFCIPPKDVVFPHLSGEIQGFGRTKKRFEQYQESHIGDGGTSYDVSVYGIVRYFHLCMENNPNILDSLFVPRECVISSTQVGELTRESRWAFLHKGCWPKFKGYAYSQLSKMSSQNRVGKRKEMVEKHGFDLKFASHVVRLLYEAEQILTTGDLDLRRDREHLKAIRRGEVSEADIRQWAADKEKQLEVAYHTSSLPWGPDEDSIKSLLLKCLEHHYGSLDNCVSTGYNAENALQEIESTILRWRSHA